MSTKKIEVPYIDQTASWPTGCESVSSVMLLQFLGLDIGVDEFVSFLPKYPVRKENNVWIGGDPSHGHLLCTERDLPAAKPSLESKKCIRFIDGYTFVNLY